MNWGDVKKSYPDQWLIVEALESHTTPNQQRHPDRLVGDRKVTNFQIEVGGMDYGLDILGIIGIDFLTQAGAVIDFGRLTMDLSFSS